MLLQLIQLIEHQPQCIYAARELIIRTRGEIAVNLLLGLNQCLAQEVEILVGAFYTVERCLTHNLNPFCVQATIYHQTMPAGPGKASGKNPYEESGDGPKFNQITETA